MPAQALKTITPAQYAFVKWLYAKHPNIAQAAEQHHASLNGFMDSLTTTFNTIIDKAPDLMKQYVAGQQQIDQLKVNLERAKLNQYPLDASGTPLYAGARGAMSTVQSNLPMIALVAGVGLVAYLVFRK